MKRSRVLLTEEVIFMNTEDKEYFNVEETAKILGVGTTKVREYAKSGKYKAIQKPDPKSKKTGYSWFFERKWVMEKAAGNEAKAAQKPADPMEAKQNETPIEQHKRLTESREIIGDRQITREDAERIIKQEDAIRKLRENLVATGELISTKSVKEAIEKAHGVMLGGLLRLVDELVDGWSIKFSFTPAQAKFMTDEYHMKLKQGWEKMRDEITKCFRS